MGASGVLTCQNFLHLLWFLQSGQLPLPEEEEEQHDVDHTQKTTQVAWARVDVEVEPDSRDTPAFCLEGHKH